MRDQPSIAVVITNYNSWALTQKCAECCLQHDSENIGTLLVYDDCSSIPMPDNFPKEARAVQGETNRGLTKSLNTAIRMTSEDIVVVFDADAYPMTPFCEAVSDMFKKDPGLGLIVFRTVGSHGRRTESYSPEPNVWTILLGQVFFARAHQWVSDHSGRLSIFTCAMAVRREAFNEIDGFDENFDWLDLDHDFSMRMNRSRWTSAICEGPMVFHEGGGSPQLTRHRVLRFYKNRWYLLKKFNRVPAASVVKLLIGLRLRAEYLVLLIFGPFLFKDPAKREDKLVGRKELIRFWKTIDQGS